MIIHKQVEMSLLNCFMKIVNLSSVDGAHYKMDPIVWLIRGNLGNSKRVMIEMIEMIDMRGRPKIRQYKKLVK